MLFTQIGKLSGGTNSPSPVNGRWTGSVGGAGSVWQLAMPIRPGAATPGLFVINF
jgi:hypothetical protein